MWSGGRSLRTIAVAGITSSLGTALSQTPLCDGRHPGHPELFSGAASCVYNEVNGAGQTLITLDDTSVIRWDHFALADPASRLTFRWAGPPGANPAVINRVTSGNAGRGGSRHDVMGELTFEGGSLLVSNPNSALHLGGTVASRALVMSTHQLAPGMEDAFLNNQPVDFTGAVQPLEVVDGRVVATEGDAVLAGRWVTISGTRPGADASEVIATNGNVRVFGGESFRLLPNGQERLVPLPGASDGFVSNSKTIRARQQIEIAGVSNVENRGLIEANGGGARVFLRVSRGDELIRNDGEIFGFVTSSHPLTNSPVIVPDENDTPSPLSTGISRFPVVNRPGEKPSSRRVVVYENAPTTASVSGQRERTARRASKRDTDSRASRVARTTASNRGADLARGRSFFGLRGGKRATQKRER